MSASNKKKLRKEQEAAKLTEKQLAAQKEAKNLRLYTTAFVSVLVVLLVVAVTVGVTQTVANSGIRERKTIALTIGDHQISNTEMNYFYMDAVNGFYSQYGTYAAMFGLDISKPLDEQVLDEATGLTWADDFLSSATDAAVAAYAMKDAAEAAGYSLTEEQLQDIDMQMQTLDMYAVLYGYQSGEAYLKAMYGSSATKESFAEYSELRALADSYRSFYASSLTYEDADLRAAEAENFDAYSSFSYHTYYLPASSFLTGGTTDAEGATTYTDEERAAAAAAAKEAADSLITEEIVSLDALEAAIDALAINEGKDASTTAYDNTIYTNISDLYVQWVADGSRMEGDMKIFENVTTSLAEDGTETETVSGYYVVYFVSGNDNIFALKNVRHILVPYAHDETGDHDHSSTDYTDAEKAAALASAEEILAQWIAGDATEESFATLANEKSADGDGTTGGLYENIYPGQMVETFNDWTFDETRVTGDTGIVESTYGYHVMYFVSDSDITYRDYMITNDLRDADVDAWYTEVTGSVTPVEGDTRYINKSIVLGGAA